MRQVRQDIRLRFFDESELLNINLADFLLAPYQRRTLTAWGAKVKVSLPSFAISGSAAFDG